MSKPLEEVIHTLERVNLSPSSFFIGLLNGGLHSDARSHFVHEMLDATYALCKSIVFPWAWDIVFSQCEDEISTLTSKTSGIHFNARSTTVEQIRSLEVGMLGKTFETEAPSVWELLGILSDVTSRAKYQRNLTYDAHQQDAEDVGMGKFEAKRDRLLDVVCHSSAHGKHE
ncbi:hypothetical protein M378DRAFT_179878 [Amanita muscaria Koide BX008]|uniref:Uncharacterized protein n=1 Tax=Amanita muscaria (strain Koide BX008) TaxID=946122 RepID=A0A0C2WYL1_AMAMK|nr:hypothetical protein M378DRAFT_179878 [Amanita muscaria Koide BX008]